MDMKSLRSVIERAAGLFAASGAKSQAEAADSVAKLLAQSDDATVDSFVANSKDALAAPPLHALPPDVIVERLNALKTDRAAFTKLYKGLEAKALGKDQARKIAALFTGARETAWPSKPAALKAIKQKFDDRVFLANKAKQDENVTPW